MGAAPDRGDTTAVTTGADTSVTTGVDTSMVGAPGQAADTAMAPTTPTDSTALPGGYDTPVTPSDSGTAAGVDTTGGYGNPPAAVDSTGTSNIPSEGGVTPDSGYAPTPSVDTTSAR